MKQKEQLFNLGRTLITPAAQETLSEAGIEPMLLLARHAHGDQGETNDDDKLANLDAIQHGDRVFTVYAVSDSTKVWVITEADRSATTILMPSDY